MSTRALKPGQLIYLSGPMTGLPELNYPAFRAAEAELVEKGFRVYNPARWEEYTGVDDFDLVDAFNDYTDVIINEVAGLVVLPGVETSVGATAEIALARVFSKPVEELVVVLARG